MDLEQLIIWIVVGGIAGILADAVVRGIGLSLGEAILVGIIGAFLGGWLFRALGIGTGDLLGTIVAAFVGAVILLLLIRGFRRTGRR